MNTETRPVSPNPPYISILKMKQLLELLSSRSFTTLTHDDLTSRGFSDNDATLSLHALRFLKLLGSDNQLQGTQVLSLKGDAKIKALKDIVRQGYYKLFERIDHPTSLTKDELYNEFLAEYKATPRIIKSALPLFLWLSAEAGFDVPEESLPRIREQSAQKKLSTTGRVSEKRISSEVKNSPIIDSNVGYHDYKIHGIRILVPKTPEVDLLIATGGLAEVAAKIESFAVAARLKNNTETGEVA